MLVIWCSELLDRDIAIISYTFVSNERGWISYTKRRVHQSEHEKKEAQRNETRREKREKTTFWNTTFWKCLPTLLWSIWKAFLSGKKVCINECDHLIYPGFSCIILSNWVHEIFITAIPKSFMLISSDEN